MNQLILSELQTVITIKTVNIVADFNIINKADTGCELITVWNIIILYSTQLKSLKKLFKRWSR